MAAYQQIDDRFVFSDSIEIEAAPEVPYQLIWRAEDWPTLLPHVNRIRLLEEREGFQRFEMETTGAAGLHVTESIRQSDFPREIRYEQLTTPPMLGEHRGRWVFEATPAGVRVTSEHTIRIRPESIEHALGRPYSLEEAALLARHFIGNHSVATLKVVKERAEPGNGTAPGRAS
jgi:aromatase